MLTATEKFIADRDAQQAYAIKLGHAQGHAQGHAEGHAQGREETKIENSRSALAQGLEPEMVHRITGLPLAEVLALQAEKATAPK